MSVILLLSLALAQQGLGERCLVGDDVAIGITIPRTENAVSDFFVFRRNRVSTLAYDFLKRFELMHALGFILNWLGDRSMKTIFGSL